MAKFKNDLDYTKETIVTIADLSQLIGSHNQNVLYFQRLKDMTKSEAVWLSDIKRITKKVMATSNFEVR